jgi:hypothetical protein
MRSGQNPRFLPAADGVMTMLRSEQKPRFLLANDEVMSAEIAKGNFSQLTRPVAQLAERRSPKPQVGGSIPSWPAIR